MFEMTKLVNAHLKKGSRPPTARARAVPGAPALSVSPTPLIAPHRSVG